MFQLLPCSRCQRTFSVRSEVSDQALLKCPNCGNQFRLGDLLDAYYGPWEILENPGMTATGEIAPGQLAVSQTAVGAPIAAVPPSTPAATSGLASEHSGIAIGVSGHEEDRGLSLDGPDLELAEDADEVSAGVPLGAAADKPKTDWSNFKPITHEEFQRMKRADRSPIWSTLQVVLGGFAAIPVSLLLIWHVLGKDVAGAGPAVARYVPWIVPEKFRGLPPADMVDAMDSQRIPRPGDSGFRNFDDVMPSAEEGSRDSSNDDGSAGASGGDAAVIATLAEDGDASGAAGDEPGAAGEGTSGNSATQESSGGADQPTADVFALLQRTKQKVDDWKDVSTAPGSVKRDAAISLFEDLASLGVRLSSIPDTQGAPALVRDKAQEISRAIKRQPDLTEVLHNAAKAQLNGNLPRSKEGWVLVCTVGEMLDQGDSWRIMVADSTLLPLDVPKIEIPKSIAPQLTTGQRLLLLGKFAAPPPADPQPEDSAPTEISETPAPAQETFRASFSYGL